MNRIGVTQIPVQCLEGTPFDLEDLSVRAVSAIEEMRDGRRDYLLDLGGDEEACYPY